MEMARTNEGDRVRAEHFGGSDILLQELEQRVRWFVRIRWFVPPAILLCTSFAIKLGYDFTWRAMIVLAILIVGYNAVLQGVLAMLRENTGDRRVILHRLTSVQVALDFAAMIYLAHFSGGAASPFVFFFIFHIIFAATLLPTSLTYLYAGLASVGMAFLAAAEYAGWIPHHALLFRGEAINLAFYPAHMVVELLFFSAALFVAATFIISLKQSMRRRIVELAEMAESQNATESSDV